MYRDQEIDWIHIDIPTEDRLMKCLTGKPQFQYCKTVDVSSTEKVAEGFNIQTQSTKRASQNIQTPCHSGPSFRGMVHEPSSVIHQLEDIGRLLHGDQTDCHTSIQCRSPDEIFYSKIEVRLN